MLEWMGPFAALADDTRLSIVEALGEGERSVNELVESSGLSQPAVSQHLKVLRVHGVVRVRPDGQRRLYSLNPVALAEIDQWLERYRHLWSGRLDSLVGYVEANPS